MTFSPLAAQRGGDVGVEDGLADGGARRGVQALGHRAWRLGAGLGSNCGAQELVDLGRLDAGQGLFLR